MACNDNIESSQGDISGIIEPPKLQNVRKRKAKSAKDTLFISPKKARTIPGSSLVSQKSSAENDGKNKKSSSSDIRDKSGDIVSIDPADALNTRSDRKATAVKSSKPELDKQAEGPLTVKPQKRTGRPQKKTSGAEEEAEPVSDRWRAVLQKVRKLEIKSKRGEVREPIELLLRKHGPDTKYGKNLRNLSQALLSEEDTYTLEESKDLGLDSSSALTRKRMDLSTESPSDARMVATRTCRSNLPQIRCHNTAPLHASHK